MTLVGQSRSAIRSRDRPPSRVIVSSTVRLAFLLHYLSLALVRDFSPRHICTRDSFIPQYSLRYSRNVATRTCVKDAMRRVLTEMKTSASL